MKPRHQVSRAAIELIKRFEGYRRIAARLPDGRWTVGYGHTHTARRGAQVSEADAEALLLYDLISVAHGVDELVYATLTQNQFDALCAFAFNLGLENFRRSAALRRVNEGASIEAAFAMELWRKAQFDGQTIIVDALVRRRAAEKLLFLTPPGEGWTPSPTPIIRPMLDEERDFAPREPVVEVAASLEPAIARPPPAEVPLPDVKPPEAENPVGAAAEQVSARLQTLFADARSEPPVFGAPPEAPPREPEPLPKPVMALAPQTAPVVRPEPEPGPQPVPPPSLAAVPPEVDEYVPARDLFQPEVVEAEEAQPHFVRPWRKARRPIGYPAILALAASGMVFFGGGGLWAGARQPVQGPVGPLAVAVLGCLAGALMLGVAAYLLMQKLGRDAEQDGWLA